MSETLYLSGGSEGEKPVFATSAGPKRPVKGLALLGISIAFTLAVLVYFGAWAASDRIEARSVDSGSEATRGEQIDGLPAERAEGDWWEEGLVWACPLH